MLLVLFVIIFSFCGCAKQQKGVFDALVTEDPIIVENLVMPLSVAADKEMEKAVLVKVSFDNKLGNRKLTLLASNQDPDPKKFSKLSGLKKGDHVKLEMEFQEETERDGKKYLLVLQWHIL